MNKRIEKISSYINNEDKVIDIGCDQALLSILLAKRGIYSIASDIRKNIIDNACEKVKELGLDKYIKFKVSDGLSNIEEEVDTLVLSGMGSFTILDILKKSNKMYKKIITISNNNHDILRNEMNNIGYIIDKEEIIYDKNKFYNLIIFKVGKTKYRNEELLIGKNHQNKELLFKKLELDLKKYKRNYSFNKDNKILDNINIIEKMLTNH